MAGRQWKRKHPFVAAPRHKQVDAEKTPRGVDLGSYSGVIQALLFFRLHQLNGARPATIRKAQITIRGF
jgi:hypothetical protein